MNSFIEVILPIVVSIAAAVLGAAMALSTFSNKQMKACLTKQEISLNNVTFECKLKETK